MTERSTVDHRNHGHPITSKDDMACLTRLRRERDQALSDLADQFHDLNHSITARAADDAAATAQLEETARLRAALEAAYEEYSRLHLTGLG